MHSRPPVRGQTLALTLALAVLSGGATVLTAAEPAPAVRPAKLFTVTYDVSNLIRRPEGKTGYDSVEDLIREVQRLINPASWHGAKEGASTLREVNGTRLEVRTSAAQHAEVKQVLAVLRRVMDVAVVVEVGLYEVERGFYDKVIRPKLGKGRQGADRPLPAAVADDVADELGKRGDLGHTNRVRIANGKGAVIFSWRQAFTYVARVSDGPKPAPVYDTGFGGVRCRAAVAVSADRRQVGLKITLRVTDLLGFKKKTVWDSNGNPVVVEVPDLATSTTLASVEADDGQAVLVPVPYQPPGARKDRVRLLFVRPLIYIEEEERVRRENGGP
jgi:hypothetical protein